MPPSHPSAPRLNTVSTNPPPQHLQIPPIPPILPLLLLPLQRPNRPPHPTSRATNLSRPNLFLNSFPHTTTTTTPRLLHLSLPFLKSPTHRREREQTARCRRIRRELCRCACEVEESGFEVVLFLEALGRWWGREIGVCCWVFMSLTAAEGAGEEGLEGLRSEHLFWFDFFGWRWIRGLLDSSRCDEEVGLFFCAT